MPVVRLGWECRQHVQNKGTTPLVPVEWDQGLSDGEEENILEMESAYLYIKCTAYMMPQEFREIIPMFMGPVKL